MISSNVIAAKFKAFSRFSRTCVDSTKDLRHKSFGWFTIQSFFAVLCFFGKT